MLRRRPHETCLAQQCKALRLLQRSWPMRYPDAVSAGSAVGWKGTKHAECFTHVNRPHRLASHG